MMTSIPSSLEKVSLNQDDLQIYLPDTDKTTVDELWARYGYEESCFPFWLESWKSVFGLYQFLKANPLDADKVLEIGCGCGVLTQLLSFDCKSMHADILWEAVEFTQRHALENQHAKEFITMDLFHSPLNTKFDCIIASDLLYEPSLAEGVYSFCKKHLSSQGKVLIADPNRVGRKNPLNKKFKTTFYVDYQEEHFVLNGEEQSCCLYTLTFNKP